MVRQRSWFPIVLILLVAAAGVGVARGDGPGVVTGLVRDVSGKVLPGATVRLSLGGLSDTALANEDGVYRFGNVPPSGGYVMRASAARYRSAEHTDIAVLAGETTRVDFALAPARRAPSGGIAGQVRSTGGAPVAGARVEVLTGPGDGRATTNRRGRFRLGSLPAGEYMLSFTSPRHATRMQAVTVGSRTAEVRVELQEPEEPTGAFFGVVRDEEGHAIAGAEVRIVDGPGDGLTLTREDGRYELPGLPPGTYAVRAAAEGFLGNTWDGIVLAAGHEVRVDFALRPNHDGGSLGTIAGRVTDREGHALAGALVRVVEGAAERRAVTGEDGHYSLPELPPGGYLVEASKEGYASARQDGRVSAGATLTMDFALDLRPSAGRITGRVTDAEGHGIQGATVAILEGARTTTGAEGGYELGDVAPGVYALRTSKDGYTGATQERVEVRAGESTRVDFQLTREPPAHGRIIGRVTDAEGHGIQGALVEIVEGAHTSTGVEGGYEIGEVAPGLYTLRASKDGYVRATQERVEVRAGETTRVDFRLTREEPRTGRIVGHVRDGEGHALAEAKVRISDGPVAREVFTDREGAYELNEVPPGVYRLVASRPAYQSADAGPIEVGAGQVREVNFALRLALGSIQGLVRNVGEERLNEVKVEIIHGEGVGRFVFSRDGDYRLGDLVPGVYALRFSKAGYRTMEVGEIRVEAGGATTRNVTMEPAD